MYNYRSVRPDAIAYIRGGKNALSIFGEARFYQQPDSVLVAFNVSGLPRDSKTGFFALHIHEGTSCTGDDFSNTGGHYNTNGEMHPNHAGDLPPLLLCNGGAYMTVCTDRFTVREIIGKTVVIHSGADDFRSQPSGNAGKKIACGVIKKL